MKRLLVFGVMLALVAPVVFAMGAQETKTEGTDEPVVIRWWGIHGGGIGQGQRAAAEAYMAQNPNVQIELKEGQQGLNDVSAFLAALSAKETPEIMFFDRFSVGEFAARGAFLALDDFIAKSQIIKIDDIFPYALAEASFDGKIYALPYDCSTHGLARNRVHYAEAGLDPDSPPKTYAEYSDLARKLTKYDDRKNITRLGTEFEFNDPTVLITLLRSQGLDWSTKDGKKMQLNTPEAIRALEAIVALSDSLGGREKVDSFSEIAEILPGMSQFAMGNTSQYYRAGVWILPPFRDYVPERVSEIAISPSPMMTGGKQWSFMGGWALAVPKYLKDEVREATFDFLEFIFSEEELNAYAIRAAKIPVFWSQVDILNEMVATKDERLFAPEIWKEYLALTEIGYSRVPTPFNFLIWTELRTAMDAATYHEMSPAEAMKQANDNVQKEIDKFHK